ncbi:MAG: thioredoxin family protein [Candidatus Hodarchaeota archaeon]
MGKVIEVFGPGCAKCKALKKSAEEAVKKLGWQEAEIRYITDMDELVTRGILSTPALAVDGKIVVSGRYIPPDRLVPILQEL